MLCAVSSWDRSLALERGGQDVREMLPSLMDAAGLRGLYLLTDTELDDTSSRTEVVLRSGLDEQFDCGAPVRSVIILESEDHCFALAAKRSSTTGETGVGFLSGSHGARASASEEKARDFATRSERENGKHEGWMAR